MLKRWWRPKKSELSSAISPAVTILTDAEFAQESEGGERPDISEVKILFLITETTFQAFATSEAEVRTFIETFVSSGYTGAIKPFVMGGLEPVGKAIIPGKKHIFPLESEYLSLLGSYCAAIRRRLRRSTLDRCASSLPLTCYALRPGGRQEPGGTNLWPRTKKLI